MTPAEVDALLARLDAIGKFCAGDSAGLQAVAPDFQQAAALIREQRAEIERIEEWSRATFEAGFQERQRAERAEAALAQAQQEIIASDARGGRIAGYLDESDAQLKQAQARIAELERDVAQWRGMADSARDYIAEGGLCSRMVGARELVAEIDAAMSAAGEKA